jgi:hypothetical protein
MSFNESRDGGHGDQGHGDEHVEELVDIEECGKQNRKPPRARKYRIRVNKERFTVDVPKMTGAEILKLAGKVPPENYKLQQKFHGGKVKTIQLTDVVDFTEPGVERFQTFPLTETEG